MAELAFHVGRHALRVPVVLPRECEIGLQMLLDDLVEGGLLGMAAALWSKSASLLAHADALAWICANTGSCAQTRQTRRFAGPSQVAPRRGVAGTQ